MNPYVYSRSRKVLQAVKAEEQTPSAVPSLLSVVKSAFTSAMSPAVAFAMVLFAAGSVGGMSLVAYSEMSNGSFAPLNHMAMEKHGSVLGVATYGYNQPNCGQWICLNYELLSFSNGGWNARIDYSGTQGPAVGSIKVNGNTFADNIRSNGSTFTGFNLQPYGTYTFIFYSKEHGRGSVLASMTFTAPATPVPNCSVRNSPPSGCYYDNSNSCGGNLVCQPTPPTSYGYSGYNLPGNGSSYGYPAQGWIETVNGGPSLSQLTVNGWAFDSKTNSPANINVTLYNSSNGQSYTLSGSPTLVRQDVLNYIYSQDHSWPANVPVEFHISSGNLPNGNYTLTNATFDGYTLYLNGSAQASFSVVGTPQVNNNVPRAGQIINNNGTVQLVGNNGLYGFPDLATFQSWGFTFSQIVTANAAEQALAQIGIVPTKKAACTNPLDQISGACGAPTPTNTVPRVGQLINVAGTIEFVGTNGLYGIPSLAVFNSWGWSFANVVAANSAEQTLAQVGVVPSRNPACNSPIDQIAGSCGNTSPATSLNVSLDPATPPSGTVTAGSVDVAVGVFRFSATGGDAAVGISGPVTDSANCNFSNIKLFDASTGAQIGSTISSLAVTSGACQGQFSNVNFVVPNNTSKSVVLKVTIPSSATGSFRFNLGGLVANTAALNGAGVYSNTMTIVPAQVSGPRVGQLINKNGTVYLVGQTGLYAFPDLATFNSWGFSFSQLVVANTAEQAFSQIGFVPKKISGCNAPLDQIAGTCGVVATSPVITSFTANPISITAGQSTILSWSVSSGAVISIDSGIGNLNGQSSITVSPTQTTTYTLKAYYGGTDGPSASATKTVTVTVSAPVVVTPPASNSPVITSAVISNGVLTVTGSSLPSGGYYAYVNGQGFIATLQGTSQITAQVGTVNGSTASVYVFNASYGASGVVTAVVTGSSGGSGGGGIPSANLTGNSQSGTLTVNSGDTINYQWSAGNAASASSYYTVNKADTCGNTSATTQYPWSAATPTGSISKQVQACQAGVTYTIVFTAPGYNQATLTVVVNPLAQATQKITGVQGLDVTTNAVTTSVITPGKFMVLYGNFIGTGDVVTINGAQQTVTSDSTTQINVSLPSSLSSIAGTAASVVVTNGSSSTSVYLVTVSH